MNYTKTFFEKVNDELAALNLKFDFTSPIDNNDKQVVELSHLTINTSKDYNFSLVSTTNALKVNYGYSTYSLLINSDVNNVLQRIFTKAREHLAKIFTEKSRVYKIDDNFYLFSPHRWRDSRTEVNRINTQANGNTIDTLDMLRLFFSDDNGLSLGFRNYTLFAKDGLLNKLSTIIPIYTTPFDIADINHFKAADADKNAVFVLRQGRNYGKFYVDNSEVAWFDRCVASGYLTTSLANYFNERIRTQSVVTTALVFQTLPKCEDCDQVDLSAIGFNDNKALNVSIRGNSFLCDKCAKDVTDKGIDLVTYTANKFNIGSNGWTPLPKFEKFDSENSPLYMGLEIEVDTSTRNEDDVDDEEYQSSDEYYDTDEHNYNANYAMHLVGSGKDVVYTKTDGSLNNGFEIVSHPMTLASHLRKMQWKKGMEYLTKMGYKSHNTSTCGLHIHINRDFFGSKAVQNVNGAKIAYLMEKNKDAFVKFSRRRTSELDRWARFGNMESRLSSRTKAMMTSAFRNNYSSRNKYVALNTIHANTFEFRIFKGTLNFGTLVATMQLVDNLARIVKDIPNNDTMFDALDKIKFDDIINYRPYAELTAYWEKRKAV